MNRRILATVLFLSFLFFPIAHADLATSEQIVDQHAWIVVNERDERTIDTAIFQEDTRKISERRRHFYPFRTWIRSEAPCFLYYWAKLDGTTGATPSLPKVAPNERIAFTEGSGAHYRRYIVHARGSSGNGQRRVEPTAETMCKGFDAPARSVASHPLQDNIRQAVDHVITLPNAEVGIIPPRAGITGSPVSLWASGVSAAPLHFPPTVLNGKRVETEARPLSFEWDTGDGGTSAPQSVYTTAEPGAAGRPAVTHVYETKSSVGRPGEGVYTIRLTVRWERRYRVVGIADPCNEWCLLDPGETRATRAYPVDEVRAILTG